MIVSVSKHFSSAHSRDSLNTDRNEPDDFVVNHNDYLPGRTSSCSHRCARLGVAYALINWTWSHRVLSGKSMLSAVDCMSWQA